MHVTYFALAFFIAVIDVHAIVSYLPPPNVCFTHKFLPNFDRQNTIILTNAKDFSWKKNGTNLLNFQGRMFQNHQIFYDTFKEPFLKNFNI